MKRVRYALAIAAVLVAATAITAALPERWINTSRDNLALRGYDAVAYWTDGRPVRGTPQLEHRWNGRSGGSRRAIIAIGSFGIRSDMHHSSAVTAPTP